MGSGFFFLSSLHSFSIVFLQSYFFLFVCLVIIFSMRYFLQMSDGVWLSI